MEGIYRTLLIVVLVLLLLKPIFNISAFILSFVFYASPRRNNNKQSADTQIVSNNNTARKKTIKTAIAYWVNGLIFYAILQTGKISFHSVRNVIYKYILKIKMEKNVILYGGAEIRSPHKLTIGKGSIIGHHSILDARNGIEIGKNVNFSHGVWLWTEQHNHNNSDFSCESSKNKKIIIQDRVWLGPRVIVLPGCTIGEGAVIGAGAVVTKDIEPFTINVGIPAKKIGERNRNLTYEFKSKPVPFI
jgi:acetyltransferase-like isoleucine patch superfamily enzyme